MIDGEEEEEEESGPLFAGQMMVLTSFLLEWRGHNTLIDMVVCFWFLVFHMNVEYSLNIIVYRLSLSFIFYNG